MHDKVFIRFPRKRIEVLMVLQVPTEAIAVAEGADVFALPQSLLSELQNGRTGYANAHQEYIRTIVQNVIIKPSSNEEDDYQLTTN
jgi:hypothetical protein